MTCYILELYLRVRMKQTHCLVLIIMDIILVFYLSYGGTSLSFLRSWGRRKALADLLVLGGGGGGGGKKNTINKYLTQKPTDT
jgi:hypothetical protein